MSQNSRSLVRRRTFLRALVLTAIGLLRGRASPPALAQSPGPIKTYLPQLHLLSGSEVFLVRNIALQNFSSSNYHSGIERLLPLMGAQGLKFYRRAQTDALSGPDGLIARDDVVLIKINAQWKYRGCTNTDVLRGLIQRILDHPDGFDGEVVMFESGQGRGSLNSDQKTNYTDNSVHANAQVETNTFNYLVQTVFAGRPVGAVLLDSFKNTVVPDADHSTVGYRSLNPHPERHAWSISYPCFNTPRGRRIELAKGIWTGSGYAGNLKLINVPVLKTHGGCGVTGALKLFYGVLSMRYSASEYHYGGIGQVLGEMFAHVRMPDLNIMDAIWVSHRGLNGAPDTHPSRQNTVLAGVDPVALDYWAGKNILYPIDGNPNHDPDHPQRYTDSCFSQYLDAAAAEINGCLPGGKRRVTRAEERIVCHEG